MEITLRNAIHKEARQALCPYWVSTVGDIILPIIGEVAQWQMVFFIFGLPGLLLVFLVFTFPEPLRRGRVASAVGNPNGLATYRALIVFMRGHVRFFFAHYSGFPIAAGVAVYFTVAGLVGGSAGSVPVPVFARWYENPNTAIGGGMANFNWCWLPFGCYSAVIGYEVDAKSYGYSGEELITKPV